MTMFVYDQSWFFVIKFQITCKHFFIIREFNTKITIKLAILITDSVALWLD